jgi:hypothetical protein
MANPVFETYTTKGIREDLADIIYNIAPTETPFMSNIGKGSSKGTYHEWQVDDLAAAADNFVAEGADAAAAVSNATTRVGNYTQISSKTVSVSGSNDAADSAGRASEMAYQLAKKGMELKRDMEVAFVGVDKASVAGSAGTPRQLASATSWIATNTNLGAGGSASNGLGTNVYTAGTDRDFTEAMLTDVIEKCWVSGGAPTIIMANAFQKRKITAFTGNATKFKNVDDKKVVNAVDVYVSDYGELSVVPNRFMQADSVLVIQPDMWSVDTYRDFQTFDLAKVGDSEQKQLLAEYTLKCSNEAANGAIRDLNVS